MPRTLIIDTDVVLAGLLRAVLELEGHAVTVCKTSAAAFTALREGPYDLIIIDPTLDTPTGGWDVLTYLELHPLLHSIPVIVCSSFPTMVQDRQPWFEAHNVSTLLKPFDLADLDARVRAALALSISVDARQQPAS